MNALPIAALILSWIALTIQGTAQVEPSDSAIEGILKETANDMAARTAKLESLANSSPSSAAGLNALFFAAFTHYDGETEDSQRRAITDYKKIIAAAQPGSWQELLASLGMLSTYHQDGDQDSVISFGEPLMKHWDETTVNRLLQDIPAIIRSKGFGLDPSAPVPLTYDSEIRLRVTLAYLRRGRMKDATELLSQIKDPNLRKLVDGEMEASRRMRDIKIDIFHRGTKSTTSSDSGDKK